MTKVKICGLFRPEDIQYVNKLKPDYIGFMFYKKSTRYVTPEMAAELKQMLAPEIVAVGVFVNDPIDFITDLVEKKIIDIVQIHGDEDEAYMQELHNCINVPIIKAVRVKDESSFDGLENYACDYFLFDTYKKGMYGGTGERFNLTLGDEKRIGKKYFVAGGLDATTVGEVLEHTYAMGVDVSGGVETNGLKDESKIAAFIEAVRSKEND